MSRFGQGASGTTAIRGLTKYSTNFNAIENPLSEGGIWLNRSSFWTRAANFNLGGGVEVVSGTQIIGPRDEADHYNDSYMLLDTNKFNIGPDCFVEVDVYKAPGLDNTVSHEIELLLRMSDITGSPKGYEVNLSGLGGYQEIVYWDGLSTDSFFHYRSNGGSSGGNGTSNSTGDVFRAEIQGTNMRTYINGTQIQSITVTDVSSGTVGIGFYRGLNGAGSLGDYGITGFRAGNL